LSRGFFFSALPLPPLFFVRAQTSLHHLYRRYILLCPLHYLSAAWFKQMRRACRCPDRRRRDVKKKKTARWRTHRQGHPIGSGPLLSTSWLAWAKTASYWGAVASKWRARRIIKASLAQARQGRVPWPPPSWPWPPPVARAPRWSFVLNHHHHNNNKMCSLSADTASHARAAARHTGTSHVWERCVWE
jgi:hypothetical protein